MSRLITIDPDILLEPDGHEFVYDVFDSSPNNNTVLKQ